MNLRERMLLYAVTDSQWLNGRSLANDLTFALEGGVRIVQLREKDLDFDSFLALAKEIKEVCQKFDVPLIINDNIDICLQSGADGVHIGQSDISARQARELLGKDKILGVTANSPHLAIKAQQDGADYIGAGAVFGSKTKNNTTVLDKQTCKEICDSVTIPVVAIGGINSQNIMELSGYGVDGVAVVSAIFASEDIKTATQKLLSQSSQMTAK